MCTTVLLHLPPHLPTLSCIRSALASSSSSRRSSSSSSSFCAAPRALAAACVTAGFPSRGVPRGPRAAQRGETH
eukprot:671753-Prorocentrum_minimum.AAC.1